MGCQDKKCHDTATAVKVVKREKCVRCRASELSRRSKRSQGKTLSREIETSEKDLRESGGSESCREKGISSWCQEKEFPRERDVKKVATDIGFRNQAVLLRSYRFSLFLTGFPPLRNFRQPACPGSTCKVAFLQVVSALGLVVEIAGGRVASAWDLFMSFYSQGIQKVLVGFLDNISWSNRYLVFSYCLFLDFFLTVLLLVLLMRLQHSLLEELRQRHDHWLFDACQSKLCSRANFTYSKRQHPFECLWMVWSWISSWWMALLIGLVCHKIRQLCLLRHLLWLGSGMIWNEFVWGGYHGWKFAWGICWL